MHKEFQVGEHVYLRITPKKIYIKIGSCANLELQYCGPLRFLEKIGQIAYRLALPPLVEVHDVFHVYFLKRYVKDYNHVIDWFVLQVEPEGEFQLEPLCILHWRNLVLRNQAIEKVKVQRRNFGPRGSHLGNG